MTRWVLVSCVALAGCPDGGVAMPPVHAGPSTGFPTPVGIVDVVQRRWPEIIACYGPLERGDVEVDFRIERDGRPTTPSIRTSSTGSVSVDHCLASLIAGVTFPAPDTSTPVAVHYLFHREPGATYSMVRDYAACYGGSPTDSRL